MKKLLLFGAGKIGRSFIGQLFSRAGYEVIFVDINKKLIRQINERGSYPVIIKSKGGDHTLEIENVRGLHLDQKKEIEELLLRVNLVATAVGQQNLSNPIQIIAKGLRSRFSDTGKEPVDIIIAENLRNAADFFRRELKNSLDEETIDKKVGLIETSIGKMVPIMSEKEIENDPLMVFAEPYNILILDRKGFKNPIPEIVGLAPKEDMKAWVDRKSFIHNLGHAAAAYYGYLQHPDQKFMYEILADKKVYNFTRSAMKEAAETLLLEYPGSFTLTDLEEHIDDLLQRFRNRALGDTVFRVGMDLYRKLGPNDRLCGAIRMAVSHSTSYRFILKALVCGFYFRAKDEKGNLYSKDKKFESHFNTEGFVNTFKDVCKFEEKEFEPLISKAVLINENIKKDKNELY